jgi:hypothetical protein
MAQALKDGKVVECWNGAWETSGYKAEHFLDPERFINTQQWYRICPEPEVPQWRKDMAQALKDGKVVETVVIIAHWEMRWVPTTLSETDFLDGKKIIPEEYYRIRPEPDVVKYLLYTHTAGWIESFIPGGPTKTIKIIRDANGNLKDAEVLK